MKNLTFLVALLLVINAQLNAQYCASDSRYSEKEYFNDAQIIIENNIKYGSAMNKTGVMQDLHLDLYYPSITADPSAARPFIMFIHGGGFVSGSKDQAHIVYECTELAKRGYLVASMQYRLGSGSDGVLEQVLRLYRADQDAQAAMRWIVHHASDYHIETSWMFAGGISAGSVMSHDLVYNQQADWDIIFPLASVQLGSLHTSGNSYTDDFSVKGLYNNCGSIVGTAVESSEMIPTISFHKEYDYVVDIDTSATFSQYGSRTMHNWLSSENVCTEFTLDTNYYSPASTTESHCPFFDAAGIQMRINRASCFFKSVMCSSCSTSKMDDIEDANCSQFVATEEPLQNQLDIFPNPFSGQVTISGIPFGTPFEITNSLGELVLESAVGSVQNLSYLPAGFYSISIVTKDKAISYKVIKE